MAKFTVNGRAVTVENNQKLLRYLRDTLHLTSVKDGCSEGACGTCTVLIDGKPTKACIPQTDKLEGKSIVTVEGLTDFEKQVYTYAFGMAGAVQCGFCIPGMVMSAKGLLDMNPNPTREEAAYAIRNNICRCTGYVKIIDAILLAAELFRKGEVPPAPADWSLGQRVPRVDVEEKGHWHRHLSRRHLSGRHDLRQRRPVPIPPGPGAGHPTRRRPGPCPVWWGSLRRRTSPGRTRWAIW